tara:strand:- start:1198 stop:1803 length:606 start_codon:yes stop_codon:yes gene_type:complete
MNTSTEIHHTAIVDEGAKIGKNCKIWHWSHICSEATIGNFCSFGQNVYIGNNVKIGNHVKIQNNVSVYDNVVLEDDVFCGPSMVFTNVYNPRSRINRKHEFRYTIVRKGATLGANSTIVCGIEIGENAFIGAGALINKNVKPFALMVGVPGKQIGWMSEFGERIDLPIQGKGDWKCKRTNTIYTLKDNLLIHSKNNKYSPN